MRQLAGGDVDVPPALDGVTAMSSACCGAFAVYVMAAAYHLRLSYGSHSSQHGIPKSGVVLTLSFVHAVCEVGGKQRRAMCICKEQDYIVQYMKRERHTKGSKGERDTTKIRGE